MSVYTITKTIMGQLTSTLNMLFFEISSDEFDIGHCPCLNVDVMKSRAKMSSRGICLLKRIFFCFKLFFDTLLMKTNVCHFCCHNFGISAVCENIFVGEKE